MKPTDEQYSRQKLWIPEKERVWMLAAAVVSLIIMIAGIWSMIHVSDSVLHSKRFEMTFKNYGSNARIALFVVLANYVLLLILQKRLVDRWSSVKKWIIKLWQSIRFLHTPIAIIAIGFIVLHVVGVFMYGFKYNFNNISGLLALLVLLPVPVSGLFRYKKLDRKWHLRLGLGFAVLFLIHSFV
ncbi:hypothetical protein SAMN03159341_10738 [Paenibacillus sp. 1_12]|uniref:hypothetical protein n=1 Tax=Paenibacillus sp. 1_12 TaxID=1566278 RepID=UPI0008EEA909|nr:hypothetical protein [Paenibacillus sp. 1_12]SFL53659.1 hypothetical protein SAMN03159341_10738 [Paenibacillus sp. 1_12]